MRGWYKDALDRPPPPYRVAIATMTAYKVELYRHVPPPGQPIHVGVHHFLVNDSILENKDIAWAVCRLYLNRSDVLSGM